MGDNATEASSLDASVDSQLTATIAGNELTGSQAANLLLALRENNYYSASDHTAHLIASVHDNVISNGAHYGAVIHAAQGVPLRPVSCTKSPPAEVDATFDSNVFSGNAVSDGHFTFDALITDLGVLKSCFVDYSTYNVVFPTGTTSTQLGGTGNSLMLNGTCITGTCN
jgi:hypothetical protein